MHPFWKNTPLLRILLPLIAGVLLEWYIPLAAFTIIIILTCGLMLAGISIIMPKRFKYNILFIKGFGIYLIAFASGILLCKNNEPVKLPDIQLNRSKSRIVWGIELTEPSQEKEQTYKCEGVIRYYVIHEKIYKTRIPVYLYLRKDKSSQTPQLGHLITTDKRPEEILNRGNPGSFDFHHYTKVKGINYQIFLKEGEYIIEKKKERFKNNLFKIRDHVLKQIKEFVPDEQRAGLAEALLIGYREDLDKSLLKAYTRTGIVHIIAISGMHLGLIFALLNLVFSPLNHIRQTRLLKPILVLLLIWIFTFLTGAGASIVRAAVMFSFISFGQQINRKTGLLNSLCNSAFVLLLYDPFLLWDIGFQLSYAAVGSIAVFYQPIRSLIKPVNKILQHVWELIAVTLAAQLITTPLCIYHFHQFPNLFLAANLVAVPLSTIILYGLIATVSFGWIPLVSSFTGKITDTLLQWLNSWVNWLNSFPFATTEGIMVSAMQCIFLYGMIFGIFHWWKNKKTIGLIASMIFILSFGVSEILDQFNRNRRCTLRVYQVKNQTAVELTAGNKIYLFGNKEKLDGLLKKDSILYVAHQFLEINRSAIYYIGRPEGIIKIKNRSIGFINNETRPENTNRCSILILTQNPKISLETLVKQTGCRQIVADNTNSYINLALWKAEAEKMKVSFFSIKERGAFELCW